MRNIVNPFKGLEKHEQELKRHSLYAEIKQLLIQSEAYDDSAIGHEFVTHFEKELPGIITAHTQDHSFINGDTSINRRVIMEAVDGGAALKAGLVAAVLMLVYKIIMVVTNNKSFSKDGAGGGRGSSSGTAQQLDDLKTETEAFKENLEQLKAVAPTIANNPLHKEEDSKVYKAADKAVRIFTVNDDGSTSEVDNPLREITKIKFVADPGNLAAFFAFKEPQHTASFFANMHETYEFLKKFNLSRFQQIMESTASTLGTSNVKAVSDSLNSEKTANAISEMVHSIASGLAPQEDIRTVEQLKELLSHTDAIEAFIGSSYVKAAAEPGEIPFLTLEELSEEVLNSSEGNSRLKAILTQAAKFNDIFNEIIDHTPELKDSVTYTQFQQVVTALKEGKELLREHKPEGYDSASARLQQIITLIEVFTVYILKIFATFRRQTDTGTQFLENNIARLKKANEAIKTVVETSKTDEGA